MHKYEKLEKLYYKKLYTKYFIYVLLFIGIISIGSVIYFKSQPKKNNIKITKEINKTKQPVKTIEKPKKIKKYVKKLTLYPIYPNIEAKKEINKTQKPIQKSTSIPKKIEKKPPVKTKKNKTPQIKIIIKTETIKDLINIYNVDPSFNSGMKIAKYYFKHKKYEESIKWCKKINKIEPETYASWYLFAKNLIQLNKNKEAKKVLIYYLSNYGPNDKIENLLRSIK